MPSDINSKVNQETDLRFWSTRPDLVGVKLAANDPNIPAWLAINKIVKDQVASGEIHWSGDPAPAAQLDPTTHPADQTTPHPAANAEIQMPDDYVGHGQQAQQPPGSVTTPAQADASTPAPAIPSAPPAPPATVKLPRPSRPPIATEPAPSIGTGSPVMQSAQHPHAHPTAAHPAAPKSRPAIDPATQKQLYAEANARFWLATGYRPGQKLDANKPADVAMMPVYSDIYKKVELEYRNGTLQLTHDTPPVRDAIMTAHDHAANAADQVASAHAATAAGDTSAAAAHMAGAQHEHDLGQHAAAEGAQYQPPTASPELVHHASHEIQQFVMNGGVGVPVLSDPGDAVAVMQATNAPAVTSAVAANADPAQTAPEQTALPTFAATPADKKAKSGAPSGKAWLGIALAGVATVGLGVYAFGNRKPQRVIVRQLAAAKR